MVWTREAKLNYYWIRRRKAVKTYVDAASLLGTSVKVARRKARKEFTREFQKFKKNTREINKLHRHTAKLEKKEKRSKQEEKKLAKMAEKEAKMRHKIDQTWNLYMSKIKFSPVGDEDERSKRDTP